MAVPIDVQTNASCTAHTHGVEAISQNPGTGAVHLEGHSSGTMEARLRPKVIRMTFVEKFLSHILPLDIFNFIRATLMTGAWSSSLGVYFPSDPRSNLRAILCLSQWDHHRSGVSITARELNINNPYLRIFDEC